MDTFNITNSNQCVDLNSINDTLVWPENSINNTLEIQPFMFPPFVIYKEHVIESGNTSLLYYQYCVPLIVLIKMFAIYIKAK